MIDALVVVATILIGAFLVLTRNLFSPVWLLLVGLLVLHQVRGKGRLASTLYRFDILVIVLYFFVRYQSVFIPFVAAIILAYILDPIVRQLNRIRISKPVASAAVVVLVWTALIYLLIRIIPPFVNETKNLLATLSQPIPHIYHAVESFLNQLKELGLDFSLAPLSQNFDGVIRGLIANLGKGVGTTFQLVFYVVLTPMAAYYFLVDGEKIVKWFYFFVPPDQKERAQAILTRLDRGLSEFFRAEVLLCLIVGCLTGCLLFILGIKYYIFLGIIAGLANFIPTIGFYLSIIPALLVALTSPNIAAALIKVLAVYIGESIFEGLFLTPKIIGSASRLHPLTVIFALLFGSALFGVWGLVISIPAAIIIREILAYENRLPPEA